MIKKNMEALMFKKFIFMFLVAFTITGCSNKTTVLRVGTSSDNPPFEYIDKDGQLKGLDIDFANLIGKNLGMEVKFIDMDFNSIIPALMAKKIDIAIAGISVTKDRNRNIDFTRRYYVASQSVVVRNDSGIRIGKEEDIRNYTIGCQSGTTGQIYLDNNFLKNNLIEESKVRKYSTNVQMILDLINGNIDIAILDDSVAEAYSKIKPVKRIFLIDTGENYAVALPKRSKLKDKISDSIDAILDSEDWQKIMEKHLF